MKFTHVALAALAVTAAPVMAQSSVTVYGVLDAGILNITNTSGNTPLYLTTATNKGTVTKMQDGGIGGSNWGMKGTEDLGGGLKANFALQGNLKVTDGSTGGFNSSSTNSLFNQLATVGLSGNFGKVDLGRQVSPIYYAFASTDARGARYFGSELTALVGLNTASNAYAGTNSNVPYGTIYNDNAIVYTSPNWNGLTVSAEYAMGNSAGSNYAQQALTAQYDAGNGLRLSAAYYSGNGNGTSAANAGVTTNRLYEIGVLYSTGPWTVSAEYMQARNPANLYVSPASSSLNLWSIGGGYKIAPNMNLTAGYYKITDNTNSGNSASQFALGLDYYLSKRTTLYVEAASTSNSGANMSLSPVYANPVAANTGNTAYMVGVRHSF